MCKAVQCCCCMHFILLTGMLTFGALVLLDVDHCKECLWFAVGTEHGSKMEVDANGIARNDTEPLLVNAQAYSGTVQNALGENAKLAAESSDITDACGIWVFHPNEWDLGSKTPGKQVEFDVQIGSAPVGATGSVSDKAISAAPLSDANTDATCKVSLASDGQLRNWNNNNAILGIRNCNKVSYIDDRTVSTMDDMMNKRDISQDSAPNSHDVFKYRRLAGPIGLLIFSATRLLQYLSLYQFLSSEKKERYEPIDCVETCVAKLGAYAGALLAFFDGVFYSQFPALVLEPLTGLNFMPTCGAIMSIQFNPTLWIIGVVLCAVGMILHLVDICVRGCTCGGKILWQFIMLVLGGAMTAFVIFLKALLILRFGFGIFFNVKLEWAFDFRFWPIQMAINLDIFQIVSLAFFAFDLVFSAFTARLKLEKKFGGADKKKQPEIEDGHFVGADRKKQGRI